MTKLVAAGAALALIAGCGGGEDAPAAPTPDGVSAAKPNAAKPNEAKPNAAKPNEAKPNEAKPNEAKANEAKANEAKANEAKANEAKPGEPVEVVLWHSYRAGEEAALDKVVKRYNASQSRVRVVAQSVPYDPFVDKITITVPRGQGPDLFIFAHNMIGNWVDKGVLEPLSGKVDGSVLKQFMPESVKATVYRKNLYGLPLAFKSLVMFYNKDLLPEPPATMEELIEKAKAIQKDKGEGFDGIVYQAGGLYFHAMWMHAFGGAVFDADHKPAFDTEAQVKALRFLRALHFEHKVLPKGLSGFMVTSLFNDGKAAVVFNGPWFRPEISDKVNYGVATIPTVEGHTPKPFLGVESLFITKTSKHKEAALEAALYLAGAESAGVRMREGKQPVAHAATLAQGAKEDPTMKVFMDQANSAVLMDATPEMQLVWTSADIAIAGGGFVEDRDPKAELEKAQRKILSDLDKAGK